MAAGAPSMPALASIRDGWLDAALPVVVGDPRVAGVAFVGSLGRGDADDWSDVDLLVAVHDDAYAGYVDPARNDLWASAEVLVDARHNAPAGAMAAGALHVRSGLPLGVDWYAYPASSAAWPSDSRVVHDPGGLRRVEEPFDAFNARGERGAATVESADEARRARLAMVPIAGKYIARRSPSAAPMIRFLGGTPEPVGPGPTEQLRTLRSITARLSAGERRLEDAIAAHLRLVESTLT